MFYWRCWGGIQLLVLHIALLLHIYGEVLVWLILKPFRSHVVETVKGIVNVPRHGEVDFSFDIIQFQGESTIFFSFQIRLLLIMFLDYSHQVLGMLFADVFNSNIINLKAKWMGRHSWDHKPGVNLLWNHPSFANLSSNSWWAIIPASGKLYIPLETAT